MTIIIVFIFIVIIITLLLIKYNFFKEISNSNINNYIEKLGIDNRPLISEDVKLLEILYNIRGINPYITKYYNKLYDLLEDFYAMQKTLLLNVNNIYLKPNELVKPFKLNVVHRDILKNDLRDQLERILKHMEEIIYIIPSQQMYLDAFSNFNKLINEHLSKMYIKVVDLPQYQIMRNDKNHDFL